MADLIVDGRDQKFVLHELLGVEKLCEHERYRDFSGEMFDMILAEAEKFALKEVYPILKEGDRQGCRLEEGQVHVPECFHKPYKLYCEGGWNSMTADQADGGQGFPAVIGIAAMEWFIHNFAFECYPGLTQGASHLVAKYGTEKQRAQYLAKMISGEWAGTMALTEPAAGSDVGNLSTKAIRQPDGTFKIVGTKCFITAIDQDLTTNIVNPVLARIEGDPPGTKGISIFLVPKYLVNDDGSLGRRNDYEVAKIEEKMGIHGSATCMVNFGDNGNCHAELLGAEREGMKVMFDMMNEMRVGVGLQGVSSSSVAYLHALEYAKQRLQGSSLAEFKNPNAPRVPIIQHPDVRRMLLWMKANTESLRALVYFTSFCLDRHRTAAEEAEREKAIGIAEVLTPIVKAYSSDIGFRVCETAIQVYGGYGYCAEYPVEQFMRDEKIASIYEGANGIQALDLVGRKLGMKKGAYFMSLLAEMNGTIAKYQDAEGTAALTADLQAGVNTLADASMFFMKCAQEGKFLVPVNHAYPFLMMMGKVVSAWLLYWMAGIAAGKLAALQREKGVSDAAGKAALVRDNREAAYYAGKLASARYFIKNVLPEAQAALAAIKNEDMSNIEIAEESF
jgi:hypothetical protein